MKYFTQAQNFRNELDDLYSSGTSNCCGAKVYDDTDICSDCGEHCSVERCCEECCGTGYVEVLDTKSVKWWTISPPYKKEKCETCNGEGWIEE